MFSKFSFLSLIFIWKCNSFACLFIRYRPHSEQYVAIKVLNGGCTPEEKARLEGRFAREVNMMTKVKHENLVKVCKNVYGLLIDIVVGNSTSSHAVFNGLTNQKFTTND